MKLPKRVWLIFAAVIATGCPGSDPSFDAADAELFCRSLQAVMVTPWTFDAYFRGARSQYDDGFKAKSIDYLMRVNNVYASASQTCSSLPVDLQPGAASCEIAAEGGGYSGPVLSILEVVGGVPSYWQTSYGQTAMLVLSLTGMDTFSTLGRGLFNSAMRFSDCPRL